jgi:uncharacterized membrane protein YedE/YeeE
MMKPRSLLAVLAAGIVFGYGLSLATMVRPEIVLQFLRFEDFGLLLVLGGAAAVTAIVYALAPRLMTKPLFGDSFGTHPSTLNRPTLLGAAIFGIGWGLSGVCPAPALAGLGGGNFELLVAVGGMFAGAWVQGWQASR